ncbi:hypothetical protein [Streptomyces sp. NPDC057690]|uniref:hypothetical protein n=1 Tax=Streptomyces sp. NPDC057690 TaxID=3346214 RepID=UPI0036758943
MTGETPTHPDTAPSAPEAPPAPPAPPAAPEIPPMPATPPRKPFRPLTAGLVGVAVGAGIMGCIWAVTAGIGPGSPATFTLEGAFELTDDATMNDNGGCGGRYDGGYDDIAEGTSVTVYGASDVVIATGVLGDSAYVSGTCTFEVAVEDVPEGEKFYKVEVSHRGTVQLTAEEAENGEFSASLG